MNILILDTATENQILVVRNNAEVVDCSHLAGLSHSTTLFDSFDTLFARAGIDPSSIEGIACGVGPGSFTGVRIAVTTARMFAQLLQIPVVPFFSQSVALCNDYIKEGEQVLVAFDAKKKRVFGALYKKGRNAVSSELLMGPGDYPVEALLEKVDSSLTLTAAGSGAILYKDVILQSHGDALFSEQVTFAPSLLADYCHELLTKKGGPYESLLPYYARLSDAEVMKNLRNQK